MGTRGAYGFRLDGEDKIAYNHWDSYPDWLGVTILEQTKALLDLGEDRLKEEVKAIRLVDGNSKATDKEIEEYGEFFTSGVSENTPTEWYSLLHEMQGKLLDHVRMHIMLDDQDFLKDSIFCEWAYIVNLDENVFEVYKGFNQDSSATGRYSKFTKDGYCGVALIATFPLNDLPTNEDFLKAVLLKDDEED